MYGLWLANIPHMTPGKIRLIYDTCESAEELYGLSRQALSKLPGLAGEDAERIADSRNRWNLEQEWMRLQEKGIHFITWENREYPKKLLHIHRPPYGLYYRGRLPDPMKKSVAIVGARTRSAYGKCVAGELAKGLAGAQVDVISGMARGIDADGHMGALQGDGATYAVLGCGIDICYPAQNEYLYTHIPQHGGILSEYPPGTPPHASLFPQRNRIISGLSDCTVVIEARIKSGSLITADYAMEQGKDVYALPGRITDELSQGCNRLIRQGAGVLSSVEEFLEDLRIAGEFQCVQTDFLKNLLEKDEALVYSLFDFAPVGIGTLVEKSPYGLSEMMELLDKLEQKGFIRETIPNYYIKCM